MKYGILIPRQLSPRQYSNIYSGSVLIKAWCIMVLEKYFPYKRETATSLGLLVLVFLLPFPLRFSNLVIGLILVISLVDVFRRKNLYDCRVHWFLPILFLYFLISVSVTGGIWLTFEKKLLLIIFPILFALNASFYRPVLRIDIYRSFILGNLAALIICIIRAMIRSISLHDGTLIFNPKVIQNTDYDFLTSSVMGGNFFFSDQLSWFLHPAYFGIYIVFSQYLIFELIRTGRETKRKLYTVFYFLLFCGLFFLSSKAAIITSLILASYLLLVLKIPSGLKIILVIGLIIISAIFFVFNPRMQAFIEIVRTGYTINPNAKYGHELRILSWDASWDLIKDNWFLGVGEGNKRSALVETYTKKGYSFPAQEMHNSHNQYLDFLIGGGVVGLSLFLIGFIELFIRSIRENNFALMAFLLIFGFNALFENLLSRYSGILFFSIFICLLGKKSIERI